MQKRLDMLIAWASQAGVDLDHTSIRLRSYLYGDDRDAIKSKFGCELDWGNTGVRVAFQHTDETAINFRFLKRATGPLKPIGGKGSTLQSDFIEIGPETFVVFEWHGAYVCEVKVKKEEEYECTPVPFPNTETTVETQ